MQVIMWIKILYPPFCQAEKILPHIPQVVKKVPIPQKIHYDNQS